MGESRLLDPAIYEKIAETINFSPLPSSRQGNVSAGVFPSAAFNDNNPTEAARSARTNRRLIGNSIAGGRCDTLSSYMQLCGAQCRVSLLHDRIQLVGFYSPACNRARVSAAAGHWSTRHTPFLPTTTNYASSQDTEAGFPRGKPADNVNAAAYPQK